MDAYEALHPGTKLGSVAKLTEAARLRGKLQRKSPRPPQWLIVKMTNNPPSRRWPHASGKSSLAAQSNKLAAASNSFRPQQSTAPRRQSMGVDDAMPRFGEGARTDWLTVMSIVVTGAGFLLAGYLLAGLILN
jgi:hypothetical protein